jgi:UDPglucose 6-dehydrogenase
MRVGVIGYGTVGRALALSFKKRGHQVRVNDVKTFDVRKYPKDFENEDLKGRIDYDTKNYIAVSCEVIFFCVPTPYNRSLLTLDLNILYNSLAQVVGYIRYSQKRAWRKPVIVIKSTVPIGATEGFSKMFNYPIVFCPEFLRQETAIEDADNPDRIIFGMTNVDLLSDVDVEITRVLTRLFEDFKCYKMFTSATHAEMAKLFSNAFLTTKVAFSQQIKKACDIFNAPDFPVELITSDKRIGPTHLDPFKGKIPADSICLPKDLRCLYHQLNKNSFFANVYDEAIEDGV